MAIALSPALTRRSHAGSRPRVPLDAVLLTVLLVGLVVVNAVKQPALMSVTQVGLLVQTAIPLFLVVFAQSLVILSGGLDLSVGGVFVVGSVLSATLLNGHNPLYLVPLVLLLAVLGLANGLLVTVGCFAPIIATFATWTIFNGIALAVLSQDGGQTPTWLTSAVAGFWGKWAHAYLWVGLLLLLWWQLKRSKLGRDLYAVGSSESSARLNGVDVRRVKITVYVLAALAAGIGGVMLAGITSAGQPTAGDPYILQSITAAVIGGTMLGGGRGGVALGISGAAVLVLIQTLIQALNLSTTWSLTISSLILVVAVAGRALLAARKEARS